MSVRGEQSSRPEGSVPAPRKRPTRRGVMASEVAVSREELELCAAQPLRLLVLMYWRCRAEGGLPRTAHDIWASLLAAEVRSAAGAGSSR
ncbi:hypothetical protein OG909_32730 (plasmid) [Streptomyces sp. NBC_01754]|uniref:hypothetical protein n=1 Tax=Streptomyces sp. NBC_01754 TaxID=2975930 RepID=UPI002DDBBE6D|nr:hypothetical protein [Streptomyces sp. NBC_01754]WSC97072.1 hypothetical protein OG909_32730 [Streptomyces sp. NBC_01754]